MPAAELVAELARLRALLRPGGWLALASINPRCIGRRSVTGHGIPVAGLAAAVSGAGYAETRTLFTEPSIDDPRSLVPDTSDAARAYETREGLRPRSNRARGMLSGIGLRDLLYPGYFLLARA